jgi:hypothetical protein
VNFAKKRILMRFFSRSLAATTFALVLALACSRGSAAITAITLGDFSNPRVLDFQSSPAGNVSGTDPLFTTFGISSVTAFSSGSISFTDTFEVRPNSSRALWENASGLAVVDPGATRLAEPATIGGDALGYDLTFDSLQEKVGISTHDQGGFYFFDFYNGATLVGHFETFATSADTNEFYFSSDLSFDRFVLSTPGGYAIDDITLDSVAAVPEPTSLALFALGMALMAAGRCRAGRMKSTCEYSERAKNDVIA